MKNIIAIQGYKNSGKDTVAEMLQYLLNNPKWLHCYKMYSWTRHKNYGENKFQIVRYADKIKAMLAELLNVSVEQFEDRNFKEKYYVDFNTLNIYNINEIEDTNILSDYKFSKELKKGNYDLAKDYYLSIRQILQFYGTEVMRKTFGDKLWILSTLKTPYKNIIIADQRFRVENTESKIHTAKIIHITRPGCEPGTHSSESELQYLEVNQEYDFLIHNDLGLEELFKKCKQIIPKLCQ